MISFTLSERDIQFINVWISQMKHYQDRDKKQKAEKAKSILKLKYKMIGYGEHRIVYDLNNKYVLKIAITKWGFKSNRTEFEIYKNCPPELREHLCPVKEFGFGWIIMEKISLKVPENEIYNEKLSQLKNRFLKAGIIPEDISWYNELNMNNMRLSETDKIIIIDYGDFKRISSSMIATSDFQATTPRNGWVEQNGRWHQGIYWFWNGTSWERR